MPDCDLGTDTVYGVIYPPQVALVGWGAWRVAPRPVAREGQVVVARTVQVTLAADHRVSDGLLGARSLADLQQQLARPVRDGLVEDLDRNQVRD